MSSFDSQVKSRARELKRFFSKSTTRKIIGGFKKGWYKIKHIRN